MDGSRLMARLERLPGVGVGASPGVRFLLDGDPAQVARFYPHPVTLESLADVARERGTPGTPAANLVGGTYVVVTGHQACLLGGPLMVAWKILTAIALARRARAHLGEDVVPVFWAATEDHDLDEIRSVHYLDRDGVLRKRSLRFPGETAATPAQAAELGPGVTELVTALLEELPGSQHRQELEAQLHHCYRPGRTAGEAFVLLLRHWFGPLGLQVLEPRQVAEQWSEPLLREGRAPFAAALVRTAGDALRERGLPAPLEPELRPQVFTIQGGERRPVIQDPDGQLSAAASLRPAWQDGALPTLAYVGGPSEVSYYGQLRQVHEQVGSTFPVIWPRASGTLLSGSQRQTLEALQLDLRAVLSGEVSLTQDAAVTVPEDATVILDRMRAHLTRSLQHLQAAVGEERGLEKALRRTRESVERNLERLAQRVEEHYARRAGVAQARREQLQATLRPRGDLQERRISTLSFLGRHGPELLEEMLTAIDPLDPAHVLLTLGA